MQSPETHKPEPGRRAMLEAEFVEALASSLGVYPDESRAMFYTLTGAAHQMTKTQLRDLTFAIKTAPDIWPNMTECVVGLIEAVEKYLAAIPPPAPGDETVAQLRSDILKQIMDITPLCRKTSRKTN